jgi:CHASE1-domain containing sensor protein
LLDRLPGLWAAGPGVLVLVVGAALSFYAFQAWRALETANAKADFDITASARLNELQRTVAKPIDAVAYVQSLIQADGQIDSTTFQRFVWAVMGNNAEILQAVWAVAETGRPGFVARNVIPPGG